MEIVGVVKEGKGSWTLSRFSKMSRFSRSLSAAQAPRSAEQAPRSKNHQIVI
jgi:hypothetical protein